MIYMFEGFIGFIGFAVGVSCAIGVLRMTAMGLRLLTRGGRLHFARQFGPVGLPVLAVMFAITAFFGGVGFGLSAYTGLTWIPQLAAAALVFAALAVEIVQRVRARKLTAALEAQRQAYLEEVQAQVQAYLGEAQADLAAAAYDPKTGFSKAG